VGAPSRSWGWEDDPVLQLGDAGAGLRGVREGHEHGVAEAGVQARSGSSGGQRELGGCDGVFAWLSKEERRKRKIGPKDTYRLPSDHEWSCAVGIGKDEDASLAPVAKSGKVPGYPWGREFPPVTKVGNFYGIETIRNPGAPSEPIKGYDDGFDRTAPVASFPSNSLGLYDLSGNVWEWCQEWYEPSLANRRVVRGSSWNYGSEINRRSSGRFFVEPMKRHDIPGFRVVLEVGSGG
jgi:formylglycine-generating enzyme required for sulfatase activity